MTQSTTVACPHCGAANVPEAQFCEACGKALPSGVSTGPRIVSADALPQTAVGHRMVSDELTKTQKSASTALLVVAILASLGAVLVLAVMRMPEASKVIPPALVVVQVAFALAFWVLWFWSKRAPLPATIVALVLYCTIVLMNVISALSQLSADPNSPRRGFGGIGIGLLDIVIIFVLAKGIGAGLKHKRLLQASGAQ